jgi:tRNA(fMet)-specific endonuclease VapC
LILLDTNICIHIINAKPQAVLQRLKGYRMGEIGLCSVVAAELAYGVTKSIRERIGDS